MDTNTLFGALVGGLCSISATMLGHWCQNKKERRINRAIILDYLKRTTDTFSCYYYDNVAPECLEVINFEGRYVENINTSRIQQK